MSLLCKFWENKYVIRGNINQMFHQVNIRKVDQDVQRCLWRDNHNKMSSTYRIAAMTFGDACSPNTTRYIKNSNTDKFKNQHPRALEAIQKFHYLEDFIDSFVTITEFTEVT